VNFIKSLPINKNADLFTQYSINYFCLFFAKKPIQFFKIVFKKID